MNSYFSINLILTYRLKKKKNLKLFLFLFFQLFCSCLHALTVSISWIHHIILFPYFFVHEWVFSIIFLTYCELFLFMDIAYNIIYLIYLSIIYLTHNWPIGGQIKVILRKKNSKKIKIILMVNLLIYFVFIKIKIIFFLYIKLQIILSKF